ncbi:hypothetical protein [Edaphobacter acidisoli]|uniref:hypothetical protein n=1 Tax=Edaphobacter acidisoli TaxID=2040573 RepID=UPI00166D2175|nr:hypothetical protein [Edaphobacter acidisoli]
MNVLRGALERHGRASTPLLIFAVTARGNGNVVKAWSAGTVSECATLSDRAEPDTVHVEQAENLAGVLTGMNFAAVASPTCRLEGAAVSSATVISSRWAGGDSIPLLVRAQIGSREVYFAPHMRQFDDSFLGKPSGMEKSFSLLAPFLLFLNHVVGEYGWHLDGHYANFTIDDPWLTDPYGALNYRGLLDQMDRHNFHTTIAFIPWNYNRSKADVVALFRAHPDRYSICIHGDNHIHREFDSYAVNPLDVQAREIRQSVARMDRFHGLTDIPYDHVMVFPHGVAPLDTFRALRAYGFLGTVNSLDVPLGEPFPDDPEFLLRPYTTNYAGLLSMLRTSAAVPIPRTDIAIQIFLGNPLLFYAHHDLFERGIGAFNQIADMVNQMQPDTIWAGLGETIRHTYPIRRRMDGDYDVRMLSTEIDLSNSGGSGAVFHVEAPEGLSPEANVTVDGASAVFELDAGSSALQLTIPAHQTRKIRIVSNGGFDPRREDIRKRSLYVYALRRISDVRDMEMSRFSWGRVIVAAYYGGNAQEWELALEHSRWLMLLCGALLGVLYLWRRSRHRNVSNVGSKK